MVCDCSAPTDICGTCAQRHCTDTCTNTAWPHCVSCGIAGHASWDRMCPVFLKKCGELNDRLEDNNLPYFPTSEEWTQVSEPPKVVYIMPSQPAEGRSYQGKRTGPAMAQTRLRWGSDAYQPRGMPTAHQNDGRMETNARSNPAAPLTPRPNE